MLIWSEISRRALLSLCVMFCPDFDRVARARYAHFPSAHSIKRVQNELGLVILGKLYPTIAVQTLLGHHLGGLDVLRRRETRLPSMNETQHPTRASTSHKNFLQRSGPADIDLWMITSLLSTRASQGKKPTQVQLVVHLLEASSSSVS